MRSDEASEGPKLLASSIIEDVKRKGTVSEIISRLGEHEKFIRDVKSGKVGGGSSGGGGAGTGYPVHAIGYDELAVAFSTSSTSYTDVTGFTTTIVTTETCTIIAYVSGAIAEDNGAGGAPTTDFRLMIGGVAQTAGTQPTLNSANAQFPLSCLFIRTGVAAGSIITKAQMKIDDGTETAYCRGELVVIAISETLGGGGSGTGDVVGPASSVDNRVVTFDGTTGKLIKDSGILITSLALLASPAFTGTPTAPTAAAGTSTTQLATTAFVTGAIREKLTAARTYYVRTDGSNSNTGLVDSAAGAFLTIQKAIDVANANLDFAGFTVTVQVRDGTYTGNAILKTMVGMAGPASFVIQGNAATPANVVISTTSASCFVLSGPNVQGYVKNLKVQTTTAGMGFDVIGGATLYWSNITFGVVANYQISLNNARSQFVGSGGYAITGGATFHIFMTGTSYLQAESIGTVTLTGTPAFIVFLYAEAGSVARINGNTYSGAATGQRYTAISNSFIFVNGAAETYLPGSTVGNLADGGRYDSLAEYTRNAAQFDKTNTTLADITGMTANVKAGRTYRFRALLYTSSNVASGVKAAIAGTCTATAIRYEGWCMAANVLTGQTRATALGTAVAAVTAQTVALITIEGTITVNAAGTLTVQFADNAGVNTSSVLVGSHFEVLDITP